MKSNIWLYTEIVLSGGYSFNLKMNFKKKQFMTTLYNNFITMV